MPCRVPARQPLEEDPRLVIRQLAEAPRERARVHRALPSREIPLAARAPLGACRSRGRPEPAGHERAARLAVPVEARAAGNLLPHAAPRRAMEDPERGVRLVRRLVPREAHVAIDAEERALGVADELRRESGEAHVELLDKRLHRLEQLSHVRGAPGLEPLPAVVPLQPAEEGECLGAESPEGRHPRSSRPLRAASVPSLRVKTSTAFCGSRPAGTSRSTSSSSRAGIVCTTTCPRSRRRTTASPSLGSACTTGGCAVESPAAPAAERSSPASAAPSRRSGDVTPRKSAVRWTSGGGPCPVTRSPIVLGEDVRPLPHSAVRIPHRPSRTGTSRGTT